MAKKTHVKTGKKSEADASVLMMKTVAGTTWRMFVPTIGFTLVGLAADYCYVRHRPPWRVRLPQTARNPTGGRTAEAASESGTTPCASSCLEIGERRLRGTAEPRQPTAHERLRWLHMPAHLRRQSTSPGPDLSGTFDGKGRPLPLP